MTDRARFGETGSWLRGPWDRLTESTARAFARAADASLSRDGGPLRRDGRWVRLLPFALIALVASILTILPSGLNDAESAHVSTVVWSAVIFVAIVIAAALFPWDRWPPDVQVLIPFGYMVVVALLRHAQGSGDAGYTVLYILPVVWIALYGPGWQLAVALPVVTGLILLPLVLYEPLTGEAHYPTNDVALLFIMVLIILFVAGALRVATNAASLDVLTGLPNRRVFMARLRGMSAEATSRDRPFGIAILDLDYFKRYNDTHGHDAGDRLLEATSLEWQEAIRHRDVLARIGGEEFGLLVRGSAADCRAVAERLLARVPHGQTASAGVTECRPGEDPADALRRADQALYAAKDAGRARVMEEAA